MSTTEEFDGPTMTCGALLRQFEPMRRKNATLHVLGTEANVFKTAAETINWQCGELAAADLVVVYTPGEVVAGSVLQPATASAADALCVVGNNADTCTVEGFTLLRCQSLRRYVSLNTWFRNTACAAHVPQSLIDSGAAILRTTKVSDVVGSRMCGLKEESVRVARYQRTGTSESRQSAVDTSKDLAMSFCGIGHMPLFAANFASLALTLIAIAIWFAGGGALLTPALITILVISTMIGVILEPWAEHYYLAPDAREVVLDEVAGMSLTLLFLPPDTGLLGFFLGFVLFRFFDIFKFGVHWIEGIPIRGTVTYDDLIAGLYAGLCLWAAFKFL